MNSEQDEKTPETNEISQEEEISSGQGPIFDFVKMMGKTVALARKAGAKTAGDVVNVSSRLGSLTTRGAEKKRKGSRNSEIEQLQIGLRDLHMRIGERVCRLAKVDGAAAQDDLQLKAMVLSALERGEKVNNITPAPDTDATEAAACAQGETADAVDQEEEGNEDVKDN
jgi:hypothetical protein